MSTLDEEKPEQDSKVERVRQAAYTLGISERTVYRRLRSGKLEQLPPESQSTDNVMSNVIPKKIEVLIQDQIVSRMDKIVCQNDMTNDNLANLRQELANRDAQIRSLLENQQELTHTIQKLQAQIFELARLALIQSAKVEDKPAEAAIAVQPQSPRPRKGLWGMLRTLWGEERDR